MTGWRLGWVTGATDRIERMLRVHQYAQACASAPAQYAAEAALTGPQEPVAEMREAFKERRDVLRTASVRGTGPSDAQGRVLRDAEGPRRLGRRSYDRGVVVDPGDAFGRRGAGYARISYATDWRRWKRPSTSWPSATAALRERRASSASQSTRLDLE